VTDTRLVEQIERDSGQSAAVVTEKMERRAPALFARFPDTGRARCLEDTRFHLEHLAAALDLDDPDLFADYRAWLVGLLAVRGIGTEDVELNFAIIGETLTARYGEGAAAAVSLLS
jgi:hypothetical protein